jgi:hypothetical protein
VQQPRSPKSVFEGRGNKQSFRQQPDVVRSGSRRLHWNVFFYLFFQYCTLLKIVENVVCLEVKEFFYPTKQQQQIPFEMI